MSQHDYDIANANGATVRGDINDAFEADQTMNSGSTAPSTTYIGMLWLDNSATPWIIKQYDGSAWIDLLRVNATDDSVAMEGALVDSDADSELSFATDDELKLKLAGTDELTVDVVSGHVTFSATETNRGIDFVPDGSGEVRAGGSKVITESSIPEDYADNVSARGVGTYMIAKRTLTSSVSPDTEVAASTLNPADCAGTVGSETMAGTWRLCGRIGGPATNANLTSLWLRVA